MVKFILGVLLFFVVLGASAQAGNNPWQTALVNDPWNYTGFVYDPKEKIAGWYKGELKFYPSPNNTVDLRTVDSSGNFDPTVITSLKYSVDNNGKVSIYAPAGQYPYVGGQMNKSQDKVSAVITIDNAGPNGARDLTPGVVILERQTLSSFSNLDLVGQWTGYEFVDSGKDGNGYDSFTITIDSRGNINGTDRKYIVNDQLKIDQSSSTFTGRAYIDANGKISMTIVSGPEKNQSTINASAQMSQKRDSISFNFRSSKEHGQVVLGTGLMMKK